MLPTAGDDERIPIEALLGGLLAGIVVRAEEDLEASVVVGGQLHLDVDLLAGGVISGDDALGVFPASLMGPRRLDVVGVSADAAPAAVLLPLDGVAAAEELVVVVVDGIGVTEAPHGVPGRRIHQAAMSLDSSCQKGYKDGELLVKICWSS